mmetsp:Transcript_12908/g.18632  ORF Transcript_12908/g.18632 Transcript_12908/m.18632 type:complete len:531 (+) Transcript_12908:240-1832(+)
MTSSSPKQESSIINDTMKRPGGSDCWWSTLPSDCECPITLERINSLPYPPFSLKSSLSISSSSSRVSSSEFFFDGLALASYIISRGTFHNPLTREPLSRDDCRLLDAHLEEHHFHDCVSERTAERKQASKNMSVYEAYALRESLKVTTVQTGSSSSRAHREAVLRSEAAAALRGLFVYNRGADHGGRSREAATARQSRSSWQDRQQQQQQYVPSVGFSLIQPRVTNNGGDRNDVADVNAAINQMEGMRIIDDEMAVGEAADQSEWEDVQISFPRLGSGTDRAANYIASATTHEAQDASENSDLLQLVRQTAERTKMEERRKKDAIQAQHKKNEARSRERKAERNRRKKETKYRSIEEKRRRDKEEEEITFARMEIERWRTQQWEEWAVKEEERAILKVRKGNDQIDNSKIDRVDEKSSFLLPHSDNVPLNQHTNIPAQDPEEMKQMERNAARAAKAAAKRKKARQRKKEKKAALDAEKAKLAKDETIRKRKEASAMKCAACGDGMLDCGFEKFGVRFCSTKCARAGPRKN